MEYYIHLEIFGIFIRFIIIRMYCRCIVLYTFPKAIAGASHGPPLALRHLAVSRACHTPGARASTAPQGAAGARQGADLQGEVEGLVGVYIDPLGL